MPAAYRHILYIRFPYLAASRLQRANRLDVPLLLIRKINGADIVVAGCAKAAMLGLNAGMRLADARALCPQVRTEICDPAADHADLQHLALWARRYSPLTAVDHQFHGIWLDVAGGEHLFGGMRGLLADCAKRLHKSRLRVVMAAAPTCGAAWALAHYGRPSQRLMTAVKTAPEITRSSFSRARLRRHLAPLPIAALRLNAAITDHMQRAGLRVIGDIIGLARAPLAARFGPDLLLRLDQALGDQDESFTPISPPKPLYICRRFAEPIGAPDDIKAMIRQLARDVAALLEQTGMATRRLRLGWQLVDGMVFAHDVHLSRPSRDVHLFQRLLANASDKINPEFGLEMGWMESLDCSPLAPLDTALPRLTIERQNDAIYAAHNEAYASLVDRLVARLGYGAVVRLAPQSCWQPEAAQSFDLPDPHRILSDCGQKAGWLGNPASRTAPPRPIRLLAYPQPVDVVALLPDHPPAQFIWQRRVHKVIHATGPERIAPAWWQAPAGTRTRDYFRLRDDQGAGFWLYREGLPERHETPAWFLHGFFA